MLAGSPRIDALRHVAERVHVPSISTFVAALIQAERIGIGLSDILRSQAADMRNRRRERALMFTQSLPVKLVFPLVLGFLPGLLVWTLGPSFHQLMTTFDSIMSGMS